MPPDFIKESEIWGPLFALGVFLVLVLASAILQLVTQLYLRRRTKAAPDALDTQVVRTIRGPLVLLLVILGLFLGFLVMTELTNERYDVLDGLDAWARNIWTIVVIIEVAYLASHLTQVLMTWYIRTIAAQAGSGIETKLLPPVRRILPLAIYGVAVMIALDSLDVSISPLLAGFGIGGIAVALAIQAPLGNFFAGTFVVTEGEIKRGDFIELDGGPSGYVVEVGWRSTKIRSRFNNLVMIPNSRMVDSIVTNYYSPTPAMNVIVNCGVSYESDLAHVERIVQEVTKEVVKDSPDAVTETDPFIGFSEFGDSNIDFFVFLQAKDRIGSFILKSLVIKQIHARFAEEGIEINYPVRRLVYPPTGNGASPVIQPQTD